MSPRKIADTIRHAGPTTDFCLARPIDTDQANDRLVGISDADGTKGNRKDDVSNDTTEAEYGGFDAAQAVLAIEQIKQLRARYFQTLDEKDWPGFAALFTEGAVLDFRGEIQHQVRDPHARAELPDDAFLFHGGPAAAATFEKHLADCVTVHHGHDPQVTLTGPDTATGLWAMWDCLDYGHELFQGYGHYRECYRRVDGRWLIERLELTRVRTVWQTVEHRWSRP